MFLWAQRDFEHAMSEQRLCRGTKWQEVQGCSAGCCRVQRASDDFRGRVAHRPWTQLGDAPGGGPCPCPQMAFHLLWLHTELPSSQLWEPALRASSDPPLSPLIPIPALQFVLALRLIPVLSTTLAAVYVYAAVFLLWITHPDFSAGALYMQMCN